jgi:predicted nucleic acid-binding protein
VIQVIDASLAIKWFAPDGDSTDRPAEAVLRDLVAHPNRFVVPELFFYELLAVLCRRLRQATDVARALDRTTRLGLRSVRFDRRLQRRAARLAFDHRLTGYDACYAAVAYELDGEWLTLDAEAHGRIAALGISRIPL